LIKYSLKPINKIGFKESLFLKILLSNFQTFQMTSINLFPVETLQTLDTNKKNVRVSIDSYNSYVKISDNSNELHILIDSEIMQAEILKNVLNMNFEYSEAKKRFLKQLFKNTVEQVNKLKDTEKEELATYFVNNINTSEVKN